MSEKRYTVPKMPAQRAFKVGDKVVTPHGALGTVTKRWRDPGMSEYQYEVEYNGMPNTYSKTELTRAHYATMEEEESSRAVCAQCGQTRNLHYYAGNYSAPDNDQVHRFSPLGESGSVKLATILFALLGTFVVALLLTYGAAMASNTVPRQSDHYVPLTVPTYVVGPYRPAGGHLRHVCAEDMPCRDGE